MAPVAGFIAAAVVSGLLASASVSSETVISGSIRASGDFPQVTAADPVVADMVARVDPAMVWDTTAGLTGVQDVTVGGQPYRITTRYTNSLEPIRKATQHAGERLQAAGLAVESQVWGAASAPNVIGELQGETAGTGIFLIGAHLDDVPVSGPAPGADDNASGSAAVLVAADILSAYRWNCTVRFGLWTGEEINRGGSTAYAQRARTLGEDLRGVLNLDMIGWNAPGSPPGIDLHADARRPATVELAQQMASVVGAYGLGLVPEVRTEGFGYSDHFSFWMAEFTAMLAIEDNAGSPIDFNPNYHTASDTLDRLDLAYFTDYVRAAVAETAHMAGCLVEGPAVSARIAGENVELRWQAGAVARPFEVHRSPSPYFIPGAATLVETLHPDANAAAGYDEPLPGGTAPEARFFQIREMNGNRGAVSRRYGVFQYGLTGG